MIEIKEKKKRKKKNKQKNESSFYSVLGLLAAFCFCLLFFLNSDFRVFIIFGVF